MELRSITDLVDRLPFQAFTIELNNGRRATVRHPENIFFIPNRAKLFHVEVYDEEEERMVLFEPSAVSALTTQNGGNGR